MNIGKVIKKTYLSEIKKRMKKTQKNDLGYLVFKDSGNFVHRWVAAKKYGKEEIKGKIIHHIDQNPENNNEDNLILMNKEDHYLLHENLKKDKNKKEGIIGALIGLNVIQAIFMIMLYPLSIILYFVIGIGAFLLYQSFKT